MSELSFESLWIKIVIPIVFYVAGFLTRVLIPTRKERYDIKASQANTSRSFLEERQKQYLSFSKSIKKAIEIKNSGAERRSVKKAYDELREAADLYFSKMDMIASYIKRNDIDKQSAKQDHIEEIKKFAFKVVPKYYEIIEQIAKQFDFQLSDRLSESTCKNVRLFLKDHLGNDGYRKLKRTWKLFD